MQKVFCLWLSGLWPDVPPPSVVVHFCVHPPLLTIHPWWMAPQWMDTMMLNNFEGIQNICSNINVMLFQINRFVMQCSALIPLNVYNILILRDRYNSFVIVYCNNILSTIITKWSKNGRPWTTYQGPCHLPVQSRPFTHGQRHIVSICPMVKNMCKSLPIQ